MSVGLMKALFWLGSLVLLTSCGETMETPVESFRVATYNAGLAPLDVPLAAERASAVTAALAAEGHDLLCLQEIWLAADWDALAVALAERLPYTVRRPAEPVEAFCTPDEFEPLQSCAEGACAGTAGGALANCALGACGAEIAALSPGCAGCLIDGIDAGADMRGLRTGCLGGEASGEAYIYGGAYDTGILTSAPILAHESRALDSYLLRAGVDYALVDAPIGPVHVFCTHFASAIPQFEYRGAHESWEGEHARQIEQLLAFVEEKAGGAATVVLLGDLNMGPTVAAAALEGEWEAHYQRVLAAGFTNPWAEQTDVACTECPESTFHAVGSAAKLIDHVLLRGFEGAALARRCMTATTTVWVGGEAVTTNLSDHFGVEVTLSVAQEVARRRAAER
jgi:endonuclease/exonuclease/phosphatase family metal-dependent hydrolase